MALDEFVEGRLYNWKFEAALEGINGDVTSQEFALITALSEMFGDVGWFKGNLAVVIEVALQAIGIDPEK